MWVLNGHLFLERVSIRAAHALWADSSVLGSSQLCWGVESREALNSCTLLMWQWCLILNRIKYVSNK